MNAYFPISRPMIGSVIPGVRVPLQTKVANYADGSNHPLIKRTKYINPLQEIPDMNQKHGSNHPIMQRLQQLLSGGGSKHPGQVPSAGEPKLLPGYEPVRENRDWRLK